MSAFPFALSGHVSIDVKSDYVARVRAGIHTKQDLLAELSNKLRFPIVSTNWDSVDDWMSDLTWLSKPRVILIHDAAPRLPRAEMVTYLDVLLQAIDALKQQRRTLLVAFPEETRALSDALSGIKR